MVQKKVKAERFNGKVTDNEDRFQEMKTQPPGRRVLRRRNYAAIAGELKLDSGKEPRGSAGQASGNVAAPPRRLFNIGINKSDNNKLDFSSSL
jgi:hypothetical protein